MAKYVYFFGGGKADGNESMKNLLGGKGANLAEMAGHTCLKLPVPPGFTITTEVCTYYYDNKRNYPKELKDQVEELWPRSKSSWARSSATPRTRCSSRSVPARAAPCPA